MSDQGHCMEQPAKILGLFSPPFNKRALYSCQPTSSSQSHFQGLSKSLGQLSPSRVIPLDSIDLLSKTTGIMGLQDGPQSLEQFVYLCYFESSIFKIFATRFHQWNPLTTKHQQDRKINFYISSSYLKDQDQRVREILQ